MTVVEGGMSVGEGDMSGGEGDMTVVEGGMNVGDEIQQNYERRHLLTIHLKHKVLTYIEYRTVSGVWRQP